MRRQVTILTLICLCILHTQLIADEKVLPYQQTEQERIQFWQQHLQHHLTAIQKAALQHLVELKASSALPAITTLLQSESAEVKAAAIRTLAALGDQTQLQLLKEVSLRDKDSNSRRQAQRAYDQLKERLEYRQKLQENQK